MTRPITLARIVGGVALAALLAATPSAQSLGIDLQRAVQKETATGDHAAAIQEYKRIVSRAGNDHEVAAQTLVRMAQAYEKLGDAESKKIYQQIIDRYPEQQQALAYARARLTGTVASSTQLVTRKVSGVSTDGTISADGRRMPFVDSEGRLVIHDFTTNSDRVLTESSDWTDFPEKPTLSKDGLQVAYSWYDNKTGNYQLRVMSLQGSGVPKPRTVLDNDFSYIVANDWSADGRLAVSITLGDRTGQIGILNPANGSYVQLTSVDWRLPGGMFFSPDGKYLSYDLPSGTTTGSRDLHLIAVDGTHQARVVSNPGYAVLAGWTPDGRHLLFTSDRTGSAGLWAVRIDNGRAAGDPLLVEDGLRSYSTMGLTKTGALYLGNSIPGRHIYIASLDFATGRQVAPTTKLATTFMGVNRFFTWSPDGKQIAYISERKTEKVIGIRDVETGALVRELRPEIEYFTWISWSPDGRTFAVGARDFKGRKGVYLIDARTQGEALDYIANAPTVEWSPDGRYLYYPSYSEPARGIVAYDVKTRAERIVDPSINPSFSMSADGAWIATNVTKSQGTADVASEIKLISTASGATRTLVTTRAPYFFVSTGWTPDGTNVIVRRMKQAEKYDAGTAELFAVSVATGAMRKLDVDVSAMAPLSPIRMHPDGKRLAFFTLGDNPLREVWVLENVLSAIEPTRAVR